MPMSSLFNSLKRSRGGSISIEFALSLPLILMIMTGLLEVGRVFFQAHMIERGIRGAALYAARNDWPLTGQAQTIVENLAKTGSPDGSAGYITSGWSDGSAQYTLDTTGTYIVAGNPVPIIQITANVPFDPLLPGLLEVAGFESYRIRLSHQQAYVGN